MLALLAAAALVSLPTEDGGLIWADIYGDGDRAVVLAHGGMFDKESWAAQAQQLAGAGFRVLALDFRGLRKIAPARRDRQDRVPRRHGPRSVPL
ncbi:MAG: hypothetical protein LC689_15945 [Myxococcales bacterium]|nr:hypothetical protein [Myxococcales bacterium]